MSNKVYDVLKWIAQVFLPALTVFLGVVLKCFNYPNTDIVLTILVAFDTFLGTLLGVSASQYNKGMNIAVVKDPDEVEVDTPFIKERGEENAED